MKTAEAAIQPDETPAPGESLKPLDPRELRKTIMKLALPTMGENCLRMMVMVADTAIVGQLGAEAVAIVGLSWSIVFFFMMITFGLNHGAVAIVARYIGAKNRESASRAAGQAILLNFILACGFSALLVTQADKLFLLMGAEKKIMAMGTLFLRTLGSIYIADALMVSANAVLRAAGDTRTPMVIVGVTNLINIFFEYCLVYGKLGFPAYGVMGSAMVISSVRILSMFLAFGGLLFGWYRLKVTWRDLLIPDRDMIQRVFRISWPSMMEQVIYSLASMGFIRIISSLGTVSLAINNILLRSESFAFMPGLSFSVAASILVGQSLGEKNREKARMVGWEAAKLGMLTMGIVGAVFFLMPWWVIRLFTSDPEVLGPASRILMIIALIEPVQGLLFVMMGTLKGAGDTRTTMKLSLLGMWFLRVPFAYLFAITLGAGVGGAWAAMCLHIAVVAVLSLRLYRRGKWLEVEV